MQDNPTDQATGWSVDAQEVERFSRIAAEWWDPKGKFAPLHRFNPVRLEFIRDHVASRFGRDGRARQPFAGLKLLDIGCGGGLLSEPMCRLGFEVTAVDASERNIKTAATHAAEQGLMINFRCSTAETLLEEGAGPFDVILNMEVIEHVADPGEYLRTCARLLAPGGLMIVATLNRTFKALALAKIGAEYILRWLPAGTHDWTKFITPDELFDLIRQAGLDPVDRKGMVFNPLGWTWGLSARDLSCNYVTASVKRSAA